MVLNVVTKAYQWYKGNFVTRFLLHALILYLLWVAFYERKSALFYFLDEKMLDHLIAMTIWGLKAMGYEVFHLETDRIAGIVESSGVMIGSPCNGISLMALFSGFILAFPAPIKSKLTMIPLGLLGIHLLNYIRILLLCLLAFYHPEWLAFNHDYTFTLIVYACIFVSWVYWVKKVQQSKTSS